MPWPPVPKSDSVPPPLWIVIVPSASVTAPVALPPSVSVPPPMFTFFVAPPRRFAKAAPELSSESVPVLFSVSVPNATAPAPLSVTRPLRTVSVPVALLSPPVSVCVPAPIFATFRFAGVAAVNAPPKLVSVPSAPMVSVAAAPLFVTRPPVVGVLPLSEPITEFCALMFSSAPATTLKAEPASTCAAPNWSTPPLIVVGPDQLLPALFSASTPAPAFMRPAVPVAVMPPSVPPSTLATAGFVTVTVRVVPPKLIAPPSVRLLPAIPPPKVKSPFTVTAFETLRAVPSASSVVPAAMVSLPMPAGPEDTTPLACVLAAAKMSVPVFNCTPPLKVLAALERTSEPVPALFSPAAVVPPIVFTIGALITRSSTEMPEVVIVRSAPLSSSVSVEIVGVVPRLSFTEVIAFVVPVSTSTLPAAPVTVGVVVPPVPLKAIVESVLLPVSVSVPAPLIVTLLVEAIEPLAVLCVALPPFRMRSPGMTIWPSGPPLPPICSVPWFTVVLPV